MRSIAETYPNYQAELEDIRNNGLSMDNLRRIIRRHAGNAARTRQLYDRYQTLQQAVPIYSRMPKFTSEAEAINNKVMNDFFSEIVDVKVGYFAGNPITYGYSSSTESDDDTGGQAAVDVAQKAVSDFVTRNNMLDVDMETTKIATICGYVGRLYYIDGEGYERVLICMPYETIILSETDMTEPEFAVRYILLQDIDGKNFFRVEFFDSRTVTIFEGTTLETLQETQPARPHMFDYCPLQGVPNNLELMGDTERVEELINAYDNAVSDSNNEIESFANAYMVFENISISDEELANAQKSGAIKFYSGAANGKVYFLTKQVNDSFVEHHLDRLQSNIYRFSKTPDLSSDTFGNATGVALKFRITGLETKCGMFEAKMKSAGTYMFKLLSSSWNKKRIPCEYLQCYMEFKRNFPLDLASEAQSCATLIGCGLPKQVAFGQLSFVDDIDYVMDLIEEEEAGVPALGVPDTLPDDQDEEEPEQDQEQEEQEEGEGLNG